MNLTAQLLLVSDRYGELTGRRRATVSTLALKQGRRLDLYADGTYTPSVRVLERAMEWFSANWPAGEPWPEGIHRPAAKPAVQISTAGEAAGATT